MAASPLWLALPYTKALALPLRRGLRLVKFTLNSSVSTKLGRCTVLSLGTPSVCTLFRRAWLTVT